MPKRERRAADCDSGSQEGEEDAADAKDTARKRRPRLVLGPREGALAGADQNSGRWRARQGVRRRVLERGLLVETRSLFQCPPCDDDCHKFWIVEDAQHLNEKYGFAKLGKGLLRMKEELDSVFDMSPYKYTVLLLLGKDQPICRSNCIPGLSEAGIVIQRRND